MQRRRIIESESTVDPRVPEQILGSFTKRHWLLLPTVPCVSMDHGDIVPARVPFGEPDGYSEMSVQFNPNLNRFAMRVPKAPGLRCVCGLHCGGPAELFPGLLYPLRRRLAQLAPDRSE